MAKEYRRLVGGPSNTFNGWQYKSGEESYTPCPPPRSADPNEIKDYVRGPLDPKTMERRVASTHDLYWGNFIVPATRLYTLKLKTPQPGTITFLVYLPLTSPGS